MQLKKPINQEAKIIFDKKFQKIVTHQHLLVAAVGTLLSVESTQAQEAKWDIDAAVLHYSETDRVTATEPVISAKRLFEDGSKLSLKFSFDTLTGASHNGAAILEGEAQTFTSASGRRSQDITGDEGYNYNSNDNDDEEDDDYSDDDNDESQSGQKSYQTKPGEVPLDDTFRDQRIAFSAQYQWPLTRLIRPNLGFSFSREYDFTSLSGNAGISFDLNDRNTTLSFQGGFEHNNINPVGGIPLAGSSMYQASESVEDATRQQYDALFSITQILSPTTLIQANYSYSYSSGYHTDPYKIVSILDNDRTFIDAIFENRPNSRAKQSIYFGVKKLFNKNIFNASYRFLNDDWDINSHTLDLRYRFNATGSWYIEPHIRHYQQSQSSFYVESINSAETAPTYLTADYRLGNLQALTTGLKIGYKKPDGGEYGIRVEKYSQHGDTRAAEVDAIILQLQYKVSF